MKALVHRVVAMDMKLLRLGEIWVWKVFFLQFFVFVLQPTGFQNTPKNWHIELRPGLNPDGYKG